LTHILNKIINISLFYEILSFTMTRCVINFQDKTLRENELNALRKQIEREYLEKVKLEDDIMEKMRSQLTLDKAAQYTKKLTGKKRDLTKQLVSYTVNACPLFAIHVSLKTCCSVKKHLCGSLNF